VVTFNGQITLSGVTDKEMELIFGFKAKHGNSLAFNPGGLQIAKLPGPMTYNNVVFSYSDLHTFNIVSEIVNELHKKEEPKAAGQ